MNHSVLVLLLVLLCSAFVPRIQSAPQRSIDFLLGDEELQAVVKPIVENSPSTTAAQEQTVAYDDDQQSEVQATVDPIENELPTVDPQHELPVTEDYPEEEQLTEDPQDDLLDPVTDSPKEDEQNTTRSSDSTSTTSTTTTSPTTNEVTTSLPKASTAPTIDSVENNSSEEQLTTNPIVVPENEDQSTTESSEDSNQLAQDVNDFIHDLANEVRSSARDEKPRPQPPKSNPPQSVENNEDDDQVQLKVDPNDTQMTTGPPLTNDQFHLLIEKLPWIGQLQFPTTESNKDSNHRAQDVDGFIHDLANEERSRARDEKPRPQPPKPNTPQYSTVLPSMLPERYDSKSVESNEDDDQVQLKVDPNDTQTTNGPSLTKDQLHLLIEKLPWIGQQRFPGYDQWQHQGFPQRSSWQHRDDRQRHYQIHGSDGFQGHGFHRSSWH